VIGLVYASDPDWLTEVDQELENLIYGLGM